MSHAQEYFDSRRQTYTEIREDVAEPERDKSSRAADVLKDPSPPFEEATPLDMLSKDWLHQDYDSTGDGSSDNDYESHFARPTGYPESTGDGSSTDSDYAARMAYTFGASITRVINEDTEAQEECEAFDDFEAVDNQPWHGYAATQNDLGFGVSPAYDDEETDDKPLRPILASDKDNKQNPVDGKRRPLWSWRRGKAAQSRVSAHEPEGINYLTEADTGVGPSESPSHLYFSG